MKKKIWIGLGAFVIAGGNMTAGLPKGAHAAESAQSLGKHQLMSSAANIILAQSQGGEGEGGEGGEGGEAGINVAATENDPVEYNIALQVIAAHYYAGLAAYEAKHMEEGAQMFAHGLAEVYVAMEEVFKKRGIEDLGKKLEAAVEAGTEKKPAKVVRARVKDVLDALAKAEKAAPKSNATPQAVKAKVMANMLRRAAAQYQAALKDKASLESYLDGLGFAVAAQKDAEKVLPWLRKTDKKKAQTVEAAIKLSKAAYPGIKGAGKVDAGKFLAAASAAEFALAGL